MRLLQILVAEQIWRPFTCCFWIAGFSFPLVIQLVWLLQYGSVLERSTYMIAPEDYLFMYIFGAVLMLIAGVIAPFLRQYVLGGPLIFMAIYVW